MTRQPRPQTAPSARLRQRLASAMPPLEVLAVLDHIASLPPAQRAGVYADYLGRFTGSVDELLEGSIDLSVTTGAETLPDITSEPEWSAGTHRAIAHLFGANADTEEERRVAETPFPYQPGM